MFKYSCQNCGINLGMYSVDKAGLIEFSKTDDAVAPFNSQEGSRFNSITCDVCGATCGLPGEAIFKEGKKGTK